MKKIYAKLKKFLRSFSDFLIIFLIGFFTYLVIGIAKLADFVIDNFAWCASLMIASYCTYKVGIEYGYGLGVSVGIIVMNTSVCAIFASTIKKGESE